MMPRLLAPCWPMIQDGRNRGDRLSDDRKNTPPTRRWNMQADKEKAYQRRHGRDISTIVRNRLLNWHSTSRQFGDLVPAMKSGMRACFESKKLPCEGLQVVGTMPYPVATPNRKKNPLTQAENTAITPAQHQAHGDQRRRSDTCPHRLRRKISSVKSIFTHQTAPASARARSRRCPSPECAIHCCISNNLQLHADQLRTSGKEPLDEITELPPQPRGVMTLPWNRLRKNSISSCAWAYERRYHGCRECCCAAKDTIQEGVERYLQRNRSGAVEADGSGMPPRRPRIPQTQCEGEAATRWILIPGSVAMARFLLYVART